MATDASLFMYGMEIDLGHDIGTTFSVLGHQVITDPFICKRQTLSLKRYLPWLCVAHV